MKEIYLVFSDTGTWLSKLIRMFTKEKYNHVSIAFDEDLREMYSFGRKYKRNPFIGGFVMENARGGLFKEASCEIYKCEVSLSSYGKMRDRALEIRKECDSYSYNFLGLFGVLFNKRWERKSKLFCSQFVSTILREAKELGIEKEPCLTTPADIAQMERLQLIYTGKLMKYTNNWYDQRRVLLSEHRDILVPTRRDVNLRSS